MTARELKRETKRLKDIQDRVDTILKTEKALAKRRARRWFTPAEKLELQIHMHFMHMGMNQIKESIKS